MKVYIASSWKNEQLARLVATELRSVGASVDCFCDDSTGRFIFHWSELGDMKDFDAITFLNQNKAQRAYVEDKKWLDWADAVVLVLPCGKSAHLEAGYIKGRGGKIFIIGELPRGEFEVMYGFADGIFHWDKLCLLKELMKG